MTSDDSGSQSDRNEGPARRSRRAGRTSQAYDFRTRFGDGPSDDDAQYPTGPAQQRAEGLREPIRRDQPIRGRGRVSVRELMEQMGVDGPPADAPRAQGTPTPQPAAPAPRPTPQRNIPKPPADLPRPQRPAAQGPAPAAPQQPTQRSVPPTPSGPPAPPVPGEVTELLPPVGPAAPRVDLSDRATAKRASAESRGQGPSEPATPAEPEVAASSTLDDPQPRRRPLEPTPDVSGAFQRISPQRLDARTPAKPRSRKENARRAATTTGRVLVTLACVLALVGTGFIWNMSRGWNNGWNHVAALVGDDNNIRNKDGQNGDETYLIVGTDSRVGKNGNLGGGDATSIEGARADTILLVNIPADRSRVVAVSWPRDLQVDRPDCQQWDFNTGEYGEELPGQSEVKINSVYADGGPTCLVKTMQQMSGLNINHFIAMDFEGFEHVVKAVGGVTVCSTVPLYDYELGYILKKAGTKKLTGRAALQYVRARNISAEGNGDYGRIKRQQLFMSSLLRSTLSSDVISNPGKLNKIVQTFIKYSNVDNVNTDSLIQLAESMQGLDAGSVTFITVPTSGTATDGSNNEIPRTDDIDAIFNAIIDDDPLPGEAKKKKKPVKKSDDKPSTSAAPATSTPSTAEATAQSPSNVTVRVLNGSGVTGVATEVMNKMLANGFNVPGVADASDNRDDTVVRYGPGEKDAAVTVAAMFPGAKIQEDRTVKVGVEVILGADFQGTSAMESVPDQGSTISAGQLPPSTSNSDLPNDLSVTNAGDTTCN